MTFGSGTSYSPSLYYVGKGRPKGWDSVTGEFQIFILEALDCGANNCSQSDFFSTNTTRTSENCRVGCNEATNPTGNPLLGYIWTDLDKSGTTSVPNDDATAGDQCSCIWGPNPIYGLDYTAADGQCVYYPDPSTSVDCEYTYTYCYDCLTEGELAPSSQPSSQPSSIPSEAPSRSQNPTPPSATTTTSSTSKSLPSFMVKM